jgi:hypothetical protein
MSKALLLLAMLAVAGCYAATYTVTYYTSTDCSDGDDTPIEDVDGSDTVCSEYDTDLFITFTDTDGVASEVFAGLPTGCDTEDDAAIELAETEDGSGCWSDDDTLSFLIVADEETTETTESSSASESESESETDTDTEDDSDSASTISFYALAFIALVCASLF